MKKIILLLSVFCALFFSLVHGQNATHSIPVSIGRNNCGAAGGRDSVSFFNYQATNLTKSTLIPTYRPRLRYGNFLVPNSRGAGYNSLGSSIAFNPKDQRLYYLYTNYSVSPVRTYVWRWAPDTTWSSSTTYTLGNTLDSLRSFAFDIGGITFDANGNAWQIEFTSTTPYKAFLRRFDLVAGVIGQADTLALTTGPNGIGGEIYQPAFGDINLLPNGKMYFAFDNKLYSPAYENWGGAGKKITATFIDTLATPAGVDKLVGLSYGDGDLISSYGATVPTSTSCVYKNLDPILAGVSNIAYSYGGSDGVSSSDMTQIISGVGVAKELVSIVPTGTPREYDVVYDIKVQNVGNTPITNLQLVDDLKLVNGAANVTNVNISMLVAPAAPSSIGLNPGYNGNLATSMLLTATTNTLSNIPTSANTFVIRLSCRFSNILDGVIYYNSAVANALGYKGVSISDVSTNGKNPDLNQNGKPDDIGEAVPTPFVVTVKPALGACSVLTDTLYKETFGRGIVSGGLSPLLPNSPNTSSSGYLGSNVNPLSINSFAIVNNASFANSSFWSSFTDHTGDVNGRMLAVNADALNNIVFRDTIPTACPGRQYSFSSWVAFPSNGFYQTLCDGLGGFRYPKLEYSLIDLASGLTVVQFQDSVPNVNTWKPISFRWVMPIGYSSLILQIKNIGEGGCGNDLLLDDIYFGPCDVLPIVGTTPSISCLGSATTFNGSLSDTTVLPGAKDYQWQIANNASGPWSNIAGATNINYTINPVTAADTGKFYRLIVAAQGGIGLSVCQSVSPAFKLNGLSPSIAALSAARNKNNVCGGKVVQLSITGGTLGSGATWQWYANGCDSVAVGSGATINVTPFVTTNYFVKAIGSCNQTICRAVTINISCNIDKDKDGIADLAESNLASAYADADADGIINAYDIDFAAYVDNNNDFINDNFQADGDSDNDGTINARDNDFAGRVDANADGVDDRFDLDYDGKINMLDLDSDNDGVTDVVESKGVDTDGDGKLDSFTDTDNDGLSQSVDANPTGGADNTGLGLGNVNMDGDLLPNYLDRDSDSDGIPDVTEAGAADTNNDAGIDAFVDSNNDGLHDLYINFGALIRTGADANGDGRADTYPTKNFDKNGLPNFMDRDSDDDGMVDVREAGLPDANLDGIADGILNRYGWSSTVAAMGAPLIINSSDGDGRPDFLDIDSDADGATDNIESMPTNTYVLPTGTDTDGDGLMDVYDNVSGFGGLGNFALDTDGDNKPDYLDSDTDGDTKPDIVEANDFNLNGLADDIVSLLNTDADGDGLDDRFDADNASNKATSFNMGANGSTSGPTPTGTRSPVQKTRTTAVDRDWRTAGFVLNVDFLQFAATKLGKNVQLKWTSVSDKTVTQFIIERSVNGGSFVQVGVLDIIVQANQLYSKQFVDVNPEQGNLHYRIKVMSDNGQASISNTVWVKNFNTDKQMNVYPIPAADRFTITLEATTASKANVQLVNNLGALVYATNHNMQIGQNNIEVKGLQKLSKGAYHLIVRFDGISYDKTIIIK